VFRYIKETSSLKKVEEFSYTLRQKKWSNFTATITPSLIRKKERPAPLAQDQKLFDRLRRKIELLQKEKERTAQDLDACLHFYHEKILPEDKAFLHSLVKRVKISYPFYRMPKWISKAERKMFRELLLDDIEQIFSMGDFAAIPVEIKEICKQLSGVDCEEVASLQLEHMKDEMEEMFREAGINIDLSGIATDDPQEEMIQKIFETISEATANENGSSRETLKTKKDQQKKSKQDAFVELQKKSLNSIYKQLVKAFHPDLEQDAEQKNRKEELMKRVTCAYEKDDLHTLLAIENEKQREATKEAAELAGLEPVRLLNEPTAAALAYSLGARSSGNTLIYDLGGGTFDVSIVNLSEQLMEVKSSHGDVALGGSDFDRMIAEKARSAFQEQHHIDLAAHPLAWARLMRAAEAAKIRLSTEASADLVEEFIAEKDGVALHLQVTVTRTEFEAMIRPKIEQSLSSVRKALEMASLTADDLNKVIMVGTYMPLVAQMLENALGIAPQSGVDPSLVVALGASIEAANLSGQSIGPRMVDITPHSLGVGCLDEIAQLKNTILIRRNTPIPCSASRVFYKMHEKQSKIEIILP